MVTRREAEIRGSVEIITQQLSADLFRVRVAIENRNGMPTEALPMTREQALAAHVHLDAHHIVGRAEGEFVSLLDPPDEFREAAAAVRTSVRGRSSSAWPAGRDTLLSSPIILYDYPQIAPESAGDMFDGTEIDEILTLHMMLLTDSEKQRNVRCRRSCTANPRADRNVAARTTLENARRRPRTAPRRRIRCHECRPLGSMTDRPHLASIRVSDVEIRPGDRVRLWPLGRADIMDIALEGRCATIEAIEQDFENRVHLAVVIDDDPGRDLGLAQHIGHRFFFSPEEVEPLPEESPSDLRDGNRRERVRRF